MAAIRSGIAATDSTVTYAPGRVTAQWVMLDELDIPIGLLTEQGHEGVVEIGLRLWEIRPSAVRKVADWIEDCLRRYDVVAARAYRRNRRVKRLLQRGGFRLVRVEGGVEFYAVTRDAFLGRRREAHHE